MNVRVMKQRSLRRVIAAAGSMVLVLGTLGVAFARADSTGRTHDPLNGRHGGAVVRELPIVSVHGPRQVPKVGRIALER